MKHLNVFEINEAGPNPEAEAAIYYANEIFKFKFKLSQRVGGYYEYEAKTNVPVWDSVKYRLYKVQGTTWKIAIIPDIAPGIKKASKWVDLVWFDIDKKHLK